MNDKIISTVKLITSILLCELIGVASALLSNIKDSSWFENLNKPSWNPPAYLFGPVWTLLYLCMGISLWLIWKSDHANLTKRKAILTFCIQLSFNFFWSILFFRFQNPFAAFILILLLLSAIILTMNFFYSISKKAMWLLVPYLLWVCFATILNYFIWKLNI